MAVDPGAVGAAAIGQHEGAVALTLDHAVHAADLLVRHMQVVSVFAPGNQPIFQLGAAAEIGFGDEPGHGRIIRLRRRYASC